MGQPTRYPPDDPREWMNRARSNLLRAANRLPGVYLDDLCYDAQQAAEKAIKAVLITRNVRFPYLHDLKELLNVVATSGWPVPLRVRTAAELTRYAVYLRYPNRLKVDEADYTRALAIAHDVLNWAATEVEGSGWDADRIRERTGAPYAAPTPQRGNSFPDEALIADLVQRIVAAASPDRIILFGSAARGTMGPHSDLDVLVVKSGDERPLGGIIRDALNGLPIVVDVVVASQDTLDRYGYSWALVYRPALEEGRVIYDAADAVAQA